MSELELLVQRAASFSLTAKTEQEQKLAERLRDEAREEIDVALFNLGGLISILSQFGPQDSRTVRFKEREKHKRLA